MIYKTSSVGTYSSAHDRSQSSILSFIRDSALFAWLVINFTAVSLLFINGGYANSPDLSLEGSLFWQIAVLIFFGIGILLQIFGQTPIRRMIAVAAPLMPMMIWIILSVTWSDFPEFSIHRAVRFELETIALILFATSYGDQYKFLRIIYLSFAFILVLDVAFLSMPDISFTPIGYTGVHYHKNMTGIFCLLALPVFLLAAIDRRIFPSRIVSIALVLCCLVIFAISLSKTSLALAPVCILLTVGFISLRRANSVTAFLVTLIVLLTGAIAIAIILFVGIEKFLIDTVGDPTFTGRDRIWQYALSLFWQSPIVGRGFGSLWNVGIFSLAQQEILRVNFVIKEGHNGYIDIITELGVVGLLLTIVFIIGTLYRLSVRIPFASVSRINFMAIYMLFAAVLINITESSIFRSGNEFWLYFVLVTHASIYIATGSRKEIGNLRGPRIIAGDRQAPRIYP
jgi:O-antigen ligase